MTYHKIKNIPLSVCTAEQKIAYNLSFMYYDTVIKEYNQLPMQFQKTELINKSIQKIMELYRSNKTKYDEDAIFSALNAGLENYINLKYHVLMSYKEIGEAFPANYLMGTEV